MLHIKKVMPMFTNIVTTANRFEKDEKRNGLIVSKEGDLKVWQTVVAVGDTVRGINVGDKVMLNFSNYAVRKYSKDSIQNDIDNNPTLTYALNWIEVDDENGKPVDLLLFSDRDVLYAFEGEEKDDVIELPPTPHIAVC